MNKIDRSPETTPRKKRYAHATTREGEARSRSEAAETRIEQAETRIEQAEMRIDQAETRIDQAEARIDQAEMRTENAQAQIEHAEKRAEHVDTTLQLVANQLRGISTPSPEDIPDDQFADQKSALDRLTDRQRAVLKLIAEGQNTKQIAATLDVNSKTVEYHRLKLMNRLNVHDIPGIVRFALCVGLIPLEN